MPCAPARDLTEHTSFMELIAVRCHMAMINDMIVCSDFATATMTLPPEWVLSFLTDVARGLAHAHSKNVVHGE